MLAPHDSGHRWGPGSVLLPARSAVSVRQGRRRPTPAERGALRLLADALLDALGERRPGRRAEEEGGDGEDVAPRRRRRPERGRRRRDEGEDGPRGERPAGPTETGAGRRPAPWALDPTAPADRRLRRLAHKRVELGGEVVADTEEEGVDEGVGLVRPWAGPGLDAEDHRRPRRADDNGPPEEPHRHHQNRNPPTAASQAPGRVRGPPPSPVQRRPRLDASRRRLRARGRRRGRDARPRRGPVEADHPEEVVGAQRREAGVRRREAGPPPATDGRPGPQPSEESLVPSRRSRS